MNLRWLSFLAVLVLSFPAVAAEPSAEEVAAYPTRPVRIIVPFATGGGTDVLARMFAHRLSAVWPNPVVVENRAGASATIGTDVVAKARPDGYTLLLIADTHAINHSLFRKLPYDPVKDFAPLIKLATAPHVLVVHPSVQANSLQEFLALAKAKPGVLNYASSGNAGTSYVLTEIFRAAAGIDLVHVPYKGAGPAMTALISGETQVTIAPAVTTLPQWRSNRARPLAILSSERSELLPGVPTLAESGFQEIRYDSWYGMLAPAGTPPAILTKVNEAIREAMNTSEIKAQMLAQGLQASGGSPGEFDQFIRSEIGKWAAAIKAAGVQAGEL